MGIHHNSWFDPTIFYIHNAPPKTLTPSLSPPFLHPPSHPRSWSPTAISWGLSKGLSLGSTLSRYEHLAFFYRPPNSQGVTIRQSLVRSPTCSHAKQLSNPNTPAVSTLALLVGLTVLLSSATLTSDDGTCTQTYDCLLMFPQEVKYVWSASWNYTKVLYILARYTPFACLSLLIRSEFRFHASARLLRFPYSTWEYICA